MTDLGSLLLYLALWIAFGVWIALQYFVRARPGAPC
jgi:hypothetical protein